MVIGMSGNGYGNGYGYGNGFDHVATRGEDNR